MTSSPGDETTAIRLLEEALHLHVNGERAPGGDETWATWASKTEELLRTERRRQFRASLRVPQQHRDHPDLATPGTTPID